LPTAACIIEARELLRFLAGISFTSVLDILIVAFVIYQLLMLVRGTRAAQMLFGIGLIVFLYYASRWWRLDTVHWLLTTLLPYAVFALIVLFQAEIRRGLARLGGNPLLPRLARLERSSSYDDILLACSLFSAEKTGALMVLERDTGLRTHTESGIGLDALLSYDLLVSIFRPQSPLHDGAVVVQKDKVAAAACFLPLSVNPALSRQLGTRHRAAIGITEETDAVAVVVSEQSGAISLAVQGSIEENISLERLRIRLGELMGVPIPPSAIPRAGAASEEAAAPAAPQPSQAPSRSPGQAANP